VNLTRAEHSSSDGPIDASCGCEVCQRHSRGFLRHLFQVGEPTASRLVSLHNVAWTLDLMGRARAAIVAGAFDAFRRAVVATWG
jgi:queuine tRNA-ribosyltransferase